MGEILEIAMFSVERFQGQNPSEVYPLWPVLWLEIHHHAASGRSSNDETVDLLHSASQKPDAHPMDDVRFNFLRDVWWQARALCKMARSPVGFLTMPTLTGRIGSQVFHCKWCRTCNLSIDIIC